MILLLIFLISYSAGLSDNAYKAIGTALSLSLLHGGPAPRFLSDTLFRLVVGETVTVDQLTLLDVTDTGISSVLKKVCYCCLV